LVLMPLRMPIFALAEQPRGIVAGGRAYAIPWALLCSKGEKGRQPRTLVLKDGYRAG
jgi:hypothetical protein